MKIITAILLSLSLALTGCLTGCGTLGKPDPAIVQFVAQTSALVGGQAALSANPGYRPALEAAKEALQGFVAAGSGNATNLQAILQQHIPNGFGSGTNSLVVGNTGILLYDGAGALIARIDQGQVFSTYAQPIAKGLLAGLSQALGESWTTTANHPLHL